LHPKVVLLTTSDHDDLEQPSSIDDTVVVSARVVPQENDLEARLRAEYKQEAQQIAHEKIPFFKIPTIVSNLWPIRLWEDVDRTDPNGGGHCVGPFPNTRTESSAFYSSISVLTSLDHRDAIAMSNLVIGHHNDNRCGRDGIVTKAVPVVKICNATR
jgi:hypothetical protein